MEFKLKENYKGEISMLIGIPVVGFLLTFVFKEENFEYFTSAHLVYSLISTLVTAVNWIVCRYIVIKLWNKYPWHLKPQKHILVEVPLLVLFTIFMMALNALFFELCNIEGVTLDQFFRNTTVILILVFGLVTYHEALFFYYQWKENFNKSMLLEKSNLQAEFDLLKSQVNPHFLFNSLNTLITYVDENQDAVQYIQRLSEFLRYSLEEKNHGFKTLKEEIEITEKYIQLQKYRFEDDLKYSIKIDQKFHSSKLPSLSIQSLVENAIKHNIISKSKALSIDIFTENDEYLIVENNFQPRENTESTKQGLYNLTQRLSYLTEKKLITSIENGKYMVKLPLVNN
jgi:two-component system, LytTR family, sensor kinase